MSSKVIVKRKVNWSIRIGEAYTAAEKKAVKITY